MKKLILLIAVCTAVIFTANAQTPDIQGTWQATTLDGKQIPKGYSVTKIYNATHFALIMDDTEGNIIAAISGPYALNGSTLIETYASSIGGKGKGGKNVRETSKITLEGDRMIQFGSLDGGKPGAEEATWERVK
jgi:hypothetical protein